MIRIGFSTKDVPALSARLTELGELDWEWEGDLEPPREGDRYEIAIELLHDEVSKLRVASNDGDNREAWPIVFSIAASLSVDLDALIDAGPTLDIRKIHRRIKAHRHESILDPARPKLAVRAAKVGRTS